MFCSNRSYGLHGLLTLTLKYQIAFRGLMRRGSSSIVISVGNVAGLARSNAAANAASAPTALPSVRKRTGMLHLLLQAQLVIMKEAILMTVIACSPQACQSDKLHSLHCPAAQHIFVSVCTVCRSAVSVSFCCEAARVNMLHWASCMSCNIQSRTENIRCVTQACSQKGV